MKKPTYELQDMINDNIERIEFELNYIKAFRSPPFDPSSFAFLKDKFKGKKKSSKGTTERQKKLSYDPPPLWKDSGFATWKEFRTNREKLHITNRIDPIDDFPMATFSVSEPGAIAIIEDDFLDLLYILKHKKLKSMRADYVSSIFFAIETTTAGLHYVLGVLGEQVKFHTRRTNRSTEVKIINHERKKDYVLDSFNKMQKEHRSLKLFSINTIEEYIMNDNITEDIMTGEKDYRFKKTLIGDLLKELNHEGKINLPQLFKTKKKTVGM